jgi:hypothetical protein
MIKTLDNLLITVVTSSGCFAQTSDRQAKSAPRLARTDDHARKLRYVEAIWRGGQKEPAPGAPDKILAPSPLLASEGNDGP